MKGGVDEDDEDDSDDDKEQSSNKRNWKEAYESLLQEHNSTLQVIIRSNFKAFCCRKLTFWG